MKNTVKKHAIEASSTIWIQLWCHKTKSLTKTVKENERDWMNFAI